MKKITAKYFKEKMNREPEHDDLERCNCKEIGLPGHYSCGWCTYCDWPRYVCNHPYPDNETNVR